jgi:hypothetical protein
VKVVFLLCLAALIPLGVAEWYSGKNVPYDTREAYESTIPMIMSISWIIRSRMTSTSTPQFVAC